MRGETWQRRQGRAPVGDQRGSHEAAMREGAARLNGIIQSTMDAIITVDERQEIVIFNPAAEAMFGCSAADVIGTPLKQFIPERFRDRHRQHIERFGTTGVTMRRMGGQAEITGLRANAEEFPLDASISQVIVGGKKLYTAFCATSLSASAPSMSFESRRRSCASFPRHCRPCAKRKRRASPASSTMSWARR